VPIGRTVAETWPFFNNTWACSESQYASTCQIVCQSVELLRRYGRFSRWRPSAVLDLFYVYLDHPRRAFVGLCHCAKFGWNRCSSFDNMPVLMFCDFGLKMPIHAPIWVVFGEFDPLDGTQFQPISQKFNLRIIAVPAVYYLCWCL